MNINHVTSSKKPEVEPLLIITDKTFQTILSFQENENTFILYSQELAGEMKELPSDITYAEARLKYQLNEQIPENLDIAELSFIFSLLTTEYESQMPNGNISKIECEFTFANINKKQGKFYHTNATDFPRYIDKLSAFDHLIGIVDGNLFRVFNLISFDQGNHTVCISSPYLAKIISIMYEASIIRSKKGVVLKKRDGTPQRKPCYSSLIKGSILNCKNTRAIMNVIQIVKIIEQTNFHSCSVNLKDIIDNNDILKTSIKGKSAKAINQILKRVFMTTYELLAEETWLLEVYKDIKLPSANDTGYIPTSTALDIELKITHNGKIKRKG